MKIGMKVLAFVGMLIGGRIYCVRYSVLLQLLVCGKCSRRDAAAGVGFRIVYGCAGVVMALGTFIAGVLLAESEYRHDWKRLSIPSKACCSVCSLSLWHVTQPRGALYPSVVGSDKCVVLVAVKILVLYLLARLYGVVAQSGCSLLAC